MKLKRCALLAALIILSTQIAASAQDGSGVVVTKFHWEKERIQTTPSSVSMATREELMAQSNREQLLRDAKNAGDKRIVNEVEKQISTHQKATTNAQRSERPRDGYRYKATLRNEGAKTIKSIDWDYIFVDPTNQQELSRHQFTSDETIKPGKSKDIEVFYLIPPVKTVSAGALDKSKKLALTEQVVVARIQYSDGTVWQRP